MNSRLVGFYQANGFLFTPAIMSVKIGTIAYREDSVWCFSWPFLNRYGTDFLWKKPRGWVLVSSNNYFSIYFGFCLSKALRHFDQQPCLETSYLRLRGTPDALPSLHIALARVWLPSRVQLYQVFFCLLSWLPLRAPWGQVRDVCFRMSAFQQSLLTWKGITIFCHHPGAAGWQELGPRCPSPEQWVARRARQDWEDCDEKEEGEQSCCIKLLVQQVHSKVVTWKYLNARVWWFCHPHRDPLWHLCSCKNLLRSGSQV